MNRIPEFLNQNLILSEFNNSQLIDSIENSEGLLNIDINQ